MSADDLLLPPDDPACLEPDPETMREMLAQVSQRVVHGSGGFRLSSNLSTAATMFSLTSAMD